MWQEGRALSDPAKSNARVSDSAEIAGAGILVNIRKAGQMAIGLRRQESLEGAAYPSQARSDLVGAAAQEIQNSNIFDHIARTDGPRHGDRRYDLVPTITQGNRNAAQAF